jgi:hypothetical protein
MKQRIGLRAETNFNIHSLLQNPARQTKQVYFLTNITFLLLKIKNTRAAPCSKAWSSIDHSGPLPDIFAAFTEILSKNLTLSHDRFYKIKG